MAFRSGAKLCCDMDSTCLGRGVGLGDLQRSFPTPVIRWLCEQGVPTARALAGAGAGLCRVALKKEGGELAQCPVPVRDGVLHCLRQFSVAAGERNHKAK